jgi:hypothetical protein
LCALGESWPSVGPDRRFFFLMNSAAAVAAAPEQVWGRFANGAISNSMVMRGSLGQRRRHFRKLIIPKIKATGNDVQVLPLDETENLELVKKCYHP